MKSSSNGTPVDMLLVEDSGFPCRRSGVKLLPPSPQHTRPDRR